MTYISCFSDFAFYFYYYFMENCHTWIIISMWQNDLHTNTSRSVWPILYGLMIKMLQYKMYPAGELRCPTTALVFIWKHCWWSAKSEPEYDRNTREKRELPTLQTKSTCSTARVKEQKKKKKTKNKNKLFTPNIGVLRTSPKHSESNRINVIFGGQHSQVRAKYVLCKVVRSYSES